MNCRAPRDHFPKSGGRTRKEGFRKLGAPTRMGGIKEAGRGGPPTPSGEVPLSRAFCHRLASIRASNGHTPFRRTVIMKTILMYSLGSHVNELVT